MAEPSNWTAAAVPDPPRRCPYCLNARADLIERDGLVWFCVVCAKRFQDAMLKELRRGES